MFELVYIITNIFLAYTVYKFMRLFFDNRKTSRRVEVISYMVYFLLITATYLFVSYGALVAGVNLLSFYLLTFNYEGTFKHRSCAAALVFIILVGVESLFVLLSKSTVLSFLSESNYDSSIGMVAIRIASFAVVLFLGKFKGMKSGKTIPPSYWFSIVFVPMSSLAIMFMFASFLESTHAQMFVLVGILLTTNFMVFYLYDAILENANAVLQKNLLERQNRYYIQEFELIKGSLSAMDTLKHDLKNHLFSIHALVENNENATALEHIARMVSICDMSKIYAKSSNFAIDSIINFKLNEAVQYDIDIELDLHVPQMLAISSFDIAIILGNLIDNAIEANKAVFCNRHIKLLINYDKGRLMVSLANPYAEERQTEGKKYLTTKLQSEGHGLGLKSVKNAVEKHNGMLSVNHENNIFTVQILMYID